MALRAALDTNRVVDLWRGDAALAELLGRCEAVWLPFIVVGELRAGFYQGSRRVANERALGRLLAKPNVGVLLPELATADLYARLVAGLRAAGTPVPSNDIWIAALALQHDLVLLTRDRHFALIPQLLAAPFGVPPGVS